ncbi:uncharacterized protein LOC106647234 [Copidosoma floridanum]|uniref:uncharacterized protein LOC106647234 n=1 Tax=Copidosoma floridanum TaxID=29053 RepID=UPI0006C999AA|nr:uncharacterized protein LOC106647234 [Copidosoma floridanum]
MVQKFHRTFKAALHCCPQSWLDSLPTVLLGHRTAYKEDLQASPAEMLLGFSPRISGEFFTTESVQANQSTFTRSLRQLLKTIRPPLEPPYTGPHRVFRRLNEHNYVLDINGKEEVVSTDTLKLAYMEQADSILEQPTAPSTAAQPPSQPLPSAPNTAAQPEVPSTADQLSPQPTSTPTAQATQSSATRHVSFPALTPVTGERVDVASQPQQPASCSRRKKTIVPRNIFSCAHTSKLPHTLPVRYI